jgi:glycosyltransferase involved in cell wall biosynthesis
MLFKFAQRMSRPELSIIVIFYNMKREAPRTLHTLRAEYQRNTNSRQYEVIVVDNGSSVPLDAKMVQSFGPNFRLIRRDPDPSPAAAINAAVTEARGKLLMICIDGARMLSPGIVHHTLKAFAMYRAPLVATLGFHLGPKMQMLSVEEGYDQQSEDLLLNSIDWQGNGYELFRISALAGSSADGWFLPIGESNCLTLNRTSYEKLGGFDERFRLPGGGFVNLDFYKRACASADELILLLGEGSFHQFHGGVATNASKSNNLSLAFQQEYFDLRGSCYERPCREFQFLGSFPKQAWPFLIHSEEALEAILNPAASREQ